MLIRQRLQSNSMAFKCSWFDSDHTCFTNSDQSSPRVLVVAFSSFKQPHFTGLVPEAPEVIRRTKAAPQPCSGDALQPLSKDLQRCRDASRLHHDALRDLLTD